MKKSDLLLHPVRMRIVQALLGDRELTTAQLQAELPDVSPATLYRQVATLLNGGALEVADERRVRGTYERTYRVRPENTHVDPEDAAAMTPEEHSEAFLAFMTARLSDFEHYLAAGEPDLERDRVGYRMAALYLSDEEVDDLLARLRDVLLPFTEKEARPGRRRRLLSTLLMPAD